MKLKVLLLILVVSCGVLAALIQLRSKTQNFPGSLAAQEAAADSSPEKRGSVGRLAAPSASPDTVPASEASDSRHEAKAENGGSSAGETRAAVMKEEEPEPDQNARLGAIVHRFAGYGTGLAGFTVHGLKETNEGLVLADTTETSKPDERETYRRGTVESPPILFAFPSNGVQPIWRVKAPADTTFQVEMAVSSDSEKWGAWQPITPTGDEILPVRYDGSPNPHYGAESGAPLIDGERLFTYVRYRLTLASTSRKTPLVEEIKLSYLDSTAGTGRPARAGEFIEMPTLSPR